MTSPPYNPTNVNTNGLGCFRFARRYSGNRENLLPEHNGRTHRAARDARVSKVESFKVKSCDTFYFMNFMNFLT